MQIKRFEAKDMTTALRSIKQELGPEAVILSARSLKVENRFLGSAKKTGVEVTAAIDAYASPVSSNSVPYSGALSADGVGGRSGRSSRMIYTNSVRSGGKSPARRRLPATYGNRHRGRNENTLGDIFQ
ncbi:MAG: hypothetical protein PVG06_15965, partial [Desulfobacterales bacterium]